MEGSGVATPFCVWLQALGRAMVVRIRDGVLRFAIPSKVVDIKSIRDNTIVFGTMYVNSFTNWLREVVLKNLRESGIVESIGNQIGDVRGTKTTIIDGTTLKQAASTTESAEFTTPIPPVVVSTDSMTHRPATKTVTTTPRPNTTTAKVTQAPTKAPTRRTTTKVKVTRPPTQPPTTPTTTPETTPIVTTSVQRNVEPLPDINSANGIIIATDTAETKITCTDEYRQFPGHTMCMQDDSRVTTSGITETEKNMVLRLHNEYRSTVEPPATDLVKIKWDDRLATVAQKWANQCTMGHDSTRNIPDIGMNIGQNVAGGYRSWAATMQAWHDEVKIYQYGREPNSYLGPGGLLKIGHYTQIVQNITYSVGCGYAKCPGSFFTRYFVCDYAGGQSNVAYPYTAGQRCETCPGSCKAGLCDCGGLVCYNGGTLNTNMCTCDCPQLYTGATCEQLNCPEQDAWVCGRDWPADYCDAYYNVRWVCPYMCGTCKYNSVPELTPNTTQVQEFVSSYGCRYTGKRSSPSECKQYGSSGQDEQVCSSKGGHLGCTECDRYFNVKRDYCPVMCGMCDPPCNGKVCANGGTLDTGTCTCACKTPYSGDTCEKADCPVSDQPHCRWWPYEYCEAYINVPEDCPYKCGICK
ncbi:hypothetical protein ScPMuIL_008830 [Solemya velum]